jgi:hypothetical protein
MDVICKYIYIYDEKISNIVRNIYYISKINKKIEINNNYKLFIVPIRSILYVYIIIMIVLINEC